MKKEKMKLNETDIPNFWGIKQPPEFTELELAVMAGGHSLPEPIKESKFQFIKSLNSKNPTLGPLS